jgi:hypothetical protein
MLAKQLLREPTVYAENPQKADLSKAVCHFARAGILKSFSSATYVRCRAAAVRIRQF